MEMSISPKFTYKFDTNTIKIPTQLSFKCVGLITKQTDTIIHKQA